MNSKNRNTVTFHSSVVFFSIFFSLLSLHLDDIIQRRIPFKIANENQLTVSCNSLSNSPAYVMDRLTCSI